MIAHFLTNGEKAFIKHRRIRYKRLPPMVREDAEEALLLLKGAFDSYAVTFWLVCGTLLGAVRDGDFVASDTDIDLACFKSDVELICLALAELQKIGFEVIAATEDDSFVELRWKQIYMHLCLMQVSTWRCGRLCEVDDWFSELRPVQFLGKEFMVPERAEEYLDYRYRGKTWRDRKAKPQLPRVHLLKQK